MLAAKFVTCEIHAFKVWYPVGLRCPACHPEAYPVVAPSRPGDVFWLRPLSYSHPAETGTKGQPSRPDAVSPPRQSRE